MSQMCFCVDIPEVSFGRFDFGDKLNADTASASFADVSLSDFQHYKETLIENGFFVFESRNFGGNYYYALQYHRDAVYITYYPALSEMRIVTEKNSAYIHYRDAGRDRRVPTNITQINLIDYGLSYVIRLSDGRFIIFDGGWDWDDDADQLMHVLAKHSIDEKPIIAAWILTHQHCDHFWAFTTFHKKYGEKVVIEKILFSFADPSAAFKEKYPGAFLKVIRGDHYDFTVRFLECIKAIGADVYCPHTGQTYQIGNAVCEILSSPDDTCRTPVTDANPLSLIIKMTLEGQTILWCADGYFAETRLAERYGAYLKADIMQLPHHGFNGGSSEGFDLIDPRVVLAPTYDDDAFAYMNIYHAYNFHLCKEMNVAEFICGKKYNGRNHTLEIPYVPNPRGREMLDNMVKDGQGFCGARVWYFDGLMLHGGEPCFLNVIRSCHPAFDVYVDFIFEDPQNGATAVKIDTSKGPLTRFNLNGIDIVENNPLQFKRTFWHKGVIPEGIPFAIRVYASMPFVASCDNGREIYRYN